MHYINVKDKVTVLRKLGKGIGEISNILNLSKSTVSYWCRDIKLSDDLIQKIKIKGKNNTVVAMLKYAETQREERKKRTEKNKEDGVNMVGKLSKKGYFDDWFGIILGRRVQRE